MKNGIHKMAPLLVVGLILISSTGCRTPLSDAKKILNIVSFFHCRSNTVVFKRPLTDLFSGPGDAQPLTVASFAVDI